MDGVYRDSYWTAPVTEGAVDQADLPTAVSVAIEGLWPHRQFFIDCSESGGAAEFFIGWFFPDGNSGDIFDWRLMERLSQMRISLSLDIYAN